MSHFCLAVNTEDKTLGLTDLVFLGGSAPPFSYMQDGKPTGFSVEVIRLVWEEISPDTEPNIQLERWSSIYKNFKKDLGYRYEHYANS